MKPLHYFYLIRWALRNDPALGYLLAYPFIVLLDFHGAVRDLRKQFSQRILHAVIIQSEHP